MPLFHGMSEICICVFLLIDCVLIASQPNLLVRPKGTFSLVDIMLVLISIDIHEMICLLSTS